MRSTSTYIKKRQLVCDNGRESAIILDLQAAKGGDNQGPTPYELLGMALSGCVAITYASIAQNSNVAFDELYAEIETFTPENEKMFTRVDVTVHIKSGANQDRLKRILEKTMAVCPVGYIYKKAGIKINETLVID
ncbi:MAG: OsmC family protein [Candidatus Ranarchaeia archaeon]